MGSSATDVWTLWRLGYAVSLLLLHVVANESSAQRPLPTKQGEVFLLDDFNNTVTRNDLGTNFFGGNVGLAETVPGVASLGLSPDSQGDPGGSLELSYSFAAAPADAFAGVFFSLFGLTDTKICLDGAAAEPEHSTHFPGYALNTRNFFGRFRPWQGRSLDRLRFDVRLKAAAPVTLRIELKDEHDRVVFTRRRLAGDRWQALDLRLPLSFSKGDPRFDWTQVSMLSLIVERRHEADRVVNPVAATLLIDNVALLDNDGEYPDLDAARGKPEYTRAFLEHIRATSSLYFLDFACTDRRCGGIIQDRSRFADLMSVGGIGFQLTAYVIAAERKYIPRAEAAERVRAVLKALHDGPQGPRRVGATGYRGFYYHFLGIDGRRKLNFDFAATRGLDESLNTVELSVIDTALALCGVLTARMYFTAPSEGDIRKLGDEIYARVDWPFLLDAASNQFILGWKPNEKRDDESGRYGRFALPDREGNGHYASKVVNGREVPATLDYYTDEGLLIALLAIASPNPKFRLDSSVFFSMVREGEPFTKTYPGSLFTYQFASCWLDMQRLGADLDPAGRVPRVNYFDDTRRAIRDCRDYCAANPRGRASLSALRWGLSACEGPFDGYFAEAAPPLALGTAGGCLDARGRFHERPLEVGTLTVYGVGSSIVHDPEAAVAGLWECQRLGLLHPRFSFADAYNLQIADAITPCTDPADPHILRTKGRWANYVGFSIDHGPMLILIDNYLSDQFVPGLFMQHPRIRLALDTLFPDARLP